MQYDGAWKLVLPDRDKALEASAWPRPLLSNGRLVLRPSLTSAARFRPEELEDRLASAAGPGGVSHEDGTIDTPRTRYVLPELRSTAAGSSDDSSATGLLLDSSGAGEPNAVETFDFGRLHFFHRPALTASGGGGGGAAAATLPLGLSAARREELRRKEVSYRLVGSELHLDTGTFTSTHEAWRRRQDSNDENDLELVATVTRTTYPVRGRQFLAVQSYRVVVEPVALGDACFYHDIVAPPGSGSSAADLRRPTFSTPIVLASSSPPTTEATSSRFLFCGDAPLVGVAAGSSVAMSVACAYGWTDRGLCRHPSYEPLGSTVVVDGSGRLAATNKVELLAPQEAIDEGRAHAFSFQIVSAVVSDRDVPRHAVAEGARRALLGALSLSSSSSPDDGSSNLTTAPLRAAHVAAWDRLWRQADVVPVPRLDLSTEQAERVKRAKRHLRYALYTLLSCTRASSEETGGRGLAEISAPPHYASTTMRASSGGGAMSGIVDISGTQAAQADVWLLPALQLLRPPVADALLSFRLAQLPVAETEAALQGRSGALYPWHFGGGASGGAAFEPMSLLLMGGGATNAPHPVFNSALVGAAAWDRYRATRDVAWLEEVGRPVIEAAADFARGCFQRDNDSKFTLVESIGLDGMATTHNTFAVSCALLALRAGIETAHALRRPVRKAWVDALAGARTLYLEHGTADPNMKWVYRKHRDDPFLESFDPSATDDVQATYIDEEGKVVQSPWVSLADPLFLVASPTHAQILHPNGRNLGSALANNVAFYEPRLWLYGRGGDHTHDHA